MNSILALMSFTVFPDVTTSNLAIEDASSGDPGLWQTTLGGGFTVSADVPLYLEGTLGYSRYDPRFVASDGTEERVIPTRWNSLTLSGGIGWDIPLREKLKLRPLFNFMLGHLETDASIGGRILDDEIGADLSFLEHGRTNAYGLGGSLMLDLEDYLPAREIDVEVRYSYLRLSSFAESSDLAKGDFNANNLGIWARWREPSGRVLLDRPLRYVYEVSYTGFFGEQRATLGFNRLTSLGLGLELDTSAHMDLVSRVRLVARYMFGSNVSGASLGVAVSF